MDDLLELFERYRCHLNRGNVPMSEFLESNYNNYIKDLEAAKDVSNNQLVGERVCKMVEDKLPTIIENSRKLVEVHKLFEHGRIVEANNAAFKVFSAMKLDLMFRYSASCLKENYYRIRPISRNGEFPIERKELFHISHEDNYLVGTERYSLPGHPCLYLASQEELCWYECGMPEKFAIAKFLVPQEEDSCLKFIDFSEKLMPLGRNFSNWLKNEKNDIENLLNNFLKYICTYPLRAACSVVNEHPKGKFIEEYIIPQMLLQWVLNDDSFDGIRYESCSNSEYVKTLCGHNIVLTTREYDEEGYDKKLRGNIKLCTPQVIDIDEIRCGTPTGSSMDNRAMANYIFYTHGVNYSTEYDTI